MGKKGLRGFQMTKKLASLNCYNHKKQVETWVIYESRETNPRTNSGILIGDWTIKRRYPDFSIWSMRPIKWFLGWFWIHKKVKKRTKLVLRVFLLFLKIFNEKKLIERNMENFFTRLKYWNLRVLFWKREKSLYFFENLP